MRLILHLVWFFCGLSSTASALAQGQFPQALYASQDQSSQGAHFNANTDAASVRNVSAEQDELVVVYPHTPDASAQDFDRYFLTQLRMALKKSGRRHRFETYDTPVFVESRSELFMAKGRYNVHWLNTNPHREQVFIPIRIPMYKGLIGWRIFFIAPGQQQTFNGLSQEQLMQLRAGQGHDWPDTKILKHNGFRLETTTQWRSLFLMLAAGHSDYLPRSVVEIWREHKAMNRLNLQVEETLALHYPSAYYFFVSKDQPELARVLELGLQRSIADGDFDRIFYQFFGDCIEAAKLHQRRIFHLENPSNNYPSDPNLWFQP